MCQGLLFNNAAGLRSQACNFIKNYSLVEVFSCEFYEIFKNTFFYRTSLVAAFENTFPDMLPNTFSDFILIDDKENKIESLYLQGCSLNICPFVS